MKKIFFVLIAITTLFISCSNATEATSSNNSSSNSSAGAVSSFTGGWYKLTQGNQITYLYYAANKYVTRAGNSSSEYSGTQLNTFKSDSFYYDTVAANYNLTRVTSNYPSWCGVNVNAGGNGGNGGGSGSDGSSTSNNTWYKYVNIDYSTGTAELIYFYFDSNHNIIRAGDSNSEFTGATLAQTKSNYSWTYLSQYLNSRSNITFGSCDILPSWCN